MPKIALALLCALLPAAAVAAAPPPAQFSPAVSNPPEEVVAASVLERTVLFRHRAAAEALGLVRPMLGPRGTVELLPERNAILLRDSGASLSRILPLLSHWDHPPSLVRVEIQMVQATPKDERPRQTAGKLEPALLRKLGEILRFEAYHLLAKTQFSVLEGEPVAYEIGDFGVQFRLGTIFEEQRIKLHGFRVVRDPGTVVEKQMLHSNLNPYLGQTMILGLASDEGAGRALMVVLACSQEK